MSGIFPIAGVSAGSAVNSSQADVAEGCDALFYPSRCRQVFDPAAANAVIAEIMNLGACAGVPYDCTVLTNLCTMIQQLINNSQPLNRTQVFFNSGPFVVPARVASVEFELIGGGGAGGMSGDGTGGGFAGNVGGGGGGGGYALRRLTGLTAGQNFSVIVGAGGVPTVGNGGNGGTSSINDISGPIVEAFGGSGGATGAGTVVAFGFGGSFSGADIGVVGGIGGFSGPNHLAPDISDVIRTYGRGGFAAGGLSTADFGGTGGNGNGYGAGGSGASGGNSLPGGAGAKGIVIARW